MEGVSGGGGEGEDKGGRQTPLPGAEGFKWTVLPGVLRRKEGETWGGGGGGGYEEPGREMGNGVICILRISEHLIFYPGLVFSHDVTGFQLIRERFLTS